MHIKVKVIGVEPHCQQYFNYIAAVSFNGGGGGNLSTWRKSLAFT
jgi:hypothetical protein